MTVARLGNGHLGKFPGVDESYFHQLDQKRKQLQKIDPAHRHQSVYMHKGLDAVALPRLGGGPGYVIVNEGAGSKRNRGRGKSWPRAWGLEAWKGGWVSPSHTADVE